MAHIILASSSPRRQELLRQLGLDFDSYSPDVDEAVQDGETVEQYVERLARDKAQVVLNQYPEAIVIAADTSLSCAGKIIGKPESKQHAFEIWSALSGQWHDVYSGICVASSSKILSTVVRTQVEFQRLSHVEMEIGRLEATMKMYTVQMSMNPENYAELADEYEEAKKKLDKLYEKWDELAEKTES